MKKGTRPPDFKVKVLNKKTGSKSNRVGAAWINSDGSLDIILDDYVTLSQDGNLLVKLFRNDFKKAGAK